MMRTLAYVGVILILLACFAYLFTYNAAILEKRIYYGPRASIAREEIITHYPYREYALTISMPLAITGTIMISLSAYRRLKMKAKNGAR
ncbi:MAG: hypothetical protein QXY34_02420 [Candidatus Bathyarchaeia archaeon]